MLQTKCCQISTWFSRKAEQKSTTKRDDNDEKAERERSKSLRPCCLATVSCTLASLPETHFTTEKELILLIRRLKFAFLPMKRSLDLAEDLAATPMNPATELRRGSAAAAPVEAAENRIVVEEEAIAESQISNLSLHSKSIMNEREREPRWFVCFLSCSRASLGVKSVCWVYYNGDGGVTISC